MTISKRKNMAVVLVIYHNITNDYNIRSSNQYTFIISQLPWVRSLGLHIGSHKAAVTVSWSIFSSGGLTGKESTSKLTQVVCRSISLWLQGRVFRASASWWLLVALSTYRPPVVPCLMVLSTGPLTTWQLASSKPRGEKVSRVTLVA